jgi:choline kinase
MSNTAIILAAGMGSRLTPAGAAESFSKPLIELEGATLLERTVGACRAAGATRVLVVTGFNAERVEAEVRRLDRGDLATVHNPDWTKANGLSLRVCRDHVADARFAMMMSDHIFDPTILRDLFALTPAPGSVTLAIDRKVASVFDLDDATKVRTDGERIVDIGKQIATYDAIDCGVFLCTRAIFDALDAVYAERGDASLSQGMARVAATGGFRGFDIGERWWQDVDTPEMLGAATELLSRLAAQPGRPMQS